MRYFRDPVTQALLTGLGAGIAKLSDLVIEDTDNSYRSPTNVVSLFDFVPGALQAPIIAGKATADVAPFVQAAIDRVAALGGGTLYVPAGVYPLARTLVVPPRVAVVGAGRTASVFAINHRGDGFSSSAPVNASNPVNIALRSFGIICRVDPGTSTGAGYHDRGGTYLEVTDIAVTGMAYGIILDQSELADIDLCQLAYQTRSAIWLVNGPTLSGGTKPGYTNRISVTRTQLNQPVDWAILDDGGWSHYFGHNNYNGGGAGHIRMAGYTQATISGGEWEGTAGPNIELSNTSLGGPYNDNGRPEMVLVQGVAIAAAGNRNAIKADACSALTLIGNFFDGATASVVGGANNVERIHAIGNRVRNPAGMFGGSRAYGAHIAEQT